MKRFVACLLALVLVLGIVPAFAQAEEPTVITIGSNAYFQDYNWPEWYMYQKMQEDLNIVIDFTQYDDDNFNLMLASGMLPDIVLCSQKQLPMVLSNKMAKDVYPYLEQYAPNLLLEGYAGTLNILRELLGGEEKALYFFAPCVGVECADGGVFTTRGYNVRWDLYKEIGMPEINSMDDYVAAIKAMQAACPETADGRKTYGAGVYGDNIRNWSTLGCFLKPAMTNLWTYGGYLYMSGWDDRMLYNGYTDLERSAFWDDMLFYNKLYREGLFDPDCFTMTMDEYNEKLAAGVYVTNYYADENMYTAMRGDDPESLAGFMVVPSDNQVVFAEKFSMLGSSPDFTGFISKDSPNWEKALQLFNYIYDPDFVRMSYCGVQGEHWDYDADGVPHLFEETIALRSANTEEWQKTGFTQILWGFTAFIDSAKHPDGYAYDLMTERENRALGQSPLRADFCAAYDVSFPNEALLRHLGEGKSIDLSNDCGQTIAAGINEIPMDVKRIMDNCNDILYRAMPKLIMADTDEAYEAAKQEALSAMKDAGEETAWAWCLDAFNQSKAVVEPIFLKARDEMNAAK